MALHAQRVCSKTIVADLRLAKYLKQFVVGQEIETAESRSLSFQVVAQALLHHVQQLGTLTELVQQLRVVAKLDAPAGTMRVGMYQRLIDVKSFHEVHQRLR